MCKELKIKVFGLKERTIPVRAIINNKSTVDAVHSTAAVSDKKLRRDFEIVNEDQSILHYIIQQVTIDQFIA